MPRLTEVGEDWVDLGSERIATLPPSRLLLYLCVHGALDGWLRLKWLADIGALVHAMTPEQLASTATLAAEQQALPQFRRCDPALPGNARQELVIPDTIPPEMSQP